jgi:hypothetical protein
VQIVEVKVKITPPCMIKHSCSYFIYLQPGKGNTQGFRRGDIRTLAVGEEFREIDSEDYRFSVNTRERFRSSFVFVRCSFGVFRLAILEFAGVTTPTP